MRTLTRYILKEMVGPTVLGFVFYTSIILMQKLFDMAGMIIQRSLSVEDVLKLLWLSLPHIIVLTVPMSLLFGVLIAVGRLSSDSEIIAMRALGDRNRTVFGLVVLEGALIGTAGAALGTALGLAGSRALLARHGFVETGRAKGTWHTHIGACDSIYLVLTEEDFRRARR